LSGYWQPVTLGDLVEVKHGYAFKGDFITDEECPNLLLTPGNFAIGGGFQFKKKKFYTGNVPEGYVLSEGDVIVTMTDLSKEADTLGYAAKVPSSDYVLLHNQRLGKLALKTDRTSLDFLHWVLRTNDYRNEILSNYSGSTVKHTSPGKISAYNFRLPPPTEQREIAAVLGALDDKIELNRKISATLEAMARALYRSWFVDFGPVHARSQGLAPAHMDKETAALFPDRFGDDGLPEGWEATTIGEVSEIVGGTTPKSKEPAYWDGGHHLWATPKDLASLGQPVLFDTTRKITDAGLATISSRLSQAGTLLLSSRAPIGYLAIAARPVAVNQGFIAIRETDKISGLEAYFWCEVNMDLIHANANGSTFQEISKKNFRPMAYALPPKPIRDAFNRQAGALFDRLSLLCQENETLTTLRDTLLPRLMSGELRVTEAREQVEELV